MAGIPGTIVPGIPIINSCPSGHGFLLQLYSLTCSGEIW